MICCTSRFMEVASLDEWEHTSSRFSGSFPNHLADRRRVTSSDFPCCGGINTNNRLIRPASNSSRYSARIRWW